MPQKQPANAAIEKLISDIANPERFSFKEHVEYFSVKFIDTIKAAANELSKENEDAIKKYVDYLTKEINQKESLETTHCVSNSTPMHKKHTAKRTCLMLRIYTRASENSVC